MKCSGFLGGNYDHILKELEEKMLQASEDMEFEKAIEYRELLGQREEDRPEAEDHRTAAGNDRDILAAGHGRGRCGGAGLLHPGRQADRQRPFLPED